MTSAERYGGKEEAERASAVFWQFSVSLAPELQ